MKRIIAPALLLTFVCFALPLTAETPGPVTRLDSMVYQGAGTERADLTDVLFSAPRLSPTERNNIGPLSSAERQRLSEPTAPGSKGMKVGVVRAVPRPIGFDAVPGDLHPGDLRALGAGLLENSGGNLAWTTAVRSEGAGAIRLQLEGKLSPNSRVFIYSGDGEVHGPYTNEQLAQQPFWTNTVYADEVFVELQMLDGAKGDGLRVVAVSHIEHPKFAPAGGAAISPSGTECFIDATCVETSEFPEILTVAKGVAQLLFNVGADTFVCSGGLLNNTLQNGTPYFLTANHCFTSQASATSLEATWNYRTVDCADPNLSPNRANFPRSLGSTLMATSATTDFTLVRLNQNPPGGAVLLGWDAGTTVATASGKKLFRLHHPQGLVQFYARHGVNTTSGVCTASPRGNFIYSTDEVSGTAGGSSGSVVLTRDSGGLFVVGQLKGACGSNLEDDCDSVNNRTIDGAFKVSFPLMSQFLAPGTGGTQCVANSTTACMLNSRFKIQVRYRGAFDNNPADTNALVKSVTGFGNPNFETGFFYFNDPNNIEMLIKLLDQGNTDSQGRRTIAVLFGSATPLRIELTITDSVNGTVKFYQSDFGAMKGTTDFTAFVK